VCPSLWFGYQKGKCRTNVQCPEGYYADEDSHFCITYAQCHGKGRYIYADKLFVKMTDQNGAVVQSMQDRRMCIKNCREFV
jgi:hypothetical protein